MNLFKKYIAIISIILLVIQSCEKPIDNTCENSSFYILENTDSTNNANTYNFSDAVLIINEGGYTHGNASITAYYPNTKEVAPNIFKSINGFNLGDVAQSVYQDKNRTYLVINNSQKIEVIYTKSFSSIETITGFKSPRYMQKDNENIVITDLYENKISVINSTSACEVANIQTKGWTEQIHKIDSEYWVIERNSIGEDKFANIIVIDISTYKITKRIKITIEPNSLVLDNDKNIWVLSSGAESENVLPMLTKINTSSKSIEQTLEFDNYNSIAQNLAFDKSSNSLFFNKENDIHIMNTPDNSLPQTKAFSTNTQIIYNIALNPNNDEIYISDAVDYVSNGKIYRYNSSGTEIDVFEVGIIPSKIIFY